MTLIIYTFLATLILWVLAAACIPHLNHDRKKEPKWRVVLCLGAYLYDCFYNITFGTLLFFELPKRIEPLTARLKRHYHDDSGYRWYLTLGFCWLISRIRGGAGHCQ